MDSEDIRKAAAIRDALDAAEAMRRDLHASLGTTEIDVSQVVFCGRLLKLISRDDAVEERVKSAVYQALSDGLAFRANALRVELLRMGVRA